MADLKVLKKVNVLNDYIAIMRCIDVPEGIELPQEQVNKISNEGIVVGIGPEAGNCVELGDKIIFNRKIQLEITPASGDYEGNSVIILKKIDMLVSMGKSTKYRVE